MRTVIYGQGAMARVVFSYARHSLDIAGFTVDDHVCDAERFCDRPLVPFSRVAAAFAPDDHTMLIAVGFLEMNRLRARKYQEAQAMGYAFTRYVHPSVMLHDGVTMEENTIILDHVSIHPGCRIGRGTFISSNVNVGHDCDIGDHSWINAGVAIAGGCRVGPGCFFGVNASVAQAVRLGAHNFIGANTLIHRDTEDDAAYLSEAGAKFRLGSDAFLRFSGLTG